MIFARPRHFPPGPTRRRGPYKAEVDLLIAPEARREDERDGVVAGLQNPIGGWRHAEADHMPRNRRQRLACSGTGISALWTSKPMRVSRETSPSMAWSRTAAVFAASGEA